MANFLQAVRDRSRQPICHAEVGHRSVSVCHLGTVALRSGLRLHWDTQHEQFVGENAGEANRWLRRDMREPWAAEWRRLTTA